VVWERIGKGFLPSRPLVILGDFWLPVVKAIPAAELNTNPIQQAKSVEEAVALLTPLLGRGAPTE